MSAATVLVWELAGRPAAPSPGMFTDGAAVCAVCGRDVSASAVAARVLGGNFGDPSLYARPDSTRVCGPCLWCVSGRPPASLRMWSIVASPGGRLPASHERAWLPASPGLCLTNRAATAPVADTLLSPPPGQWLVSVATSGQKHVLPYARVNRGGGPFTVRMETADVTADPGTWRTVLTAAARLRAAGHGAELVREGHPDARAVKTGPDLAAWRATAGPLLPFLRSPVLDLALWCLTKPVIAHYAGADHDRT